MKKFKKLTSAMLALCMTLSVLLGNFSGDIFKTIDVSAASTEIKTQEKDDWTGYGYDFRNSGLPDAYDMISGDKKSELKDMYKNHYSLDYWYYFRGANGEWYYCLQMGVHHYDEKGQLVSTLNNLPQFYSKNLDSTQQDWLKYVTVYGFNGTTHYGHTTQEEYIATQMLIWSVVSKYYTPDNTNLGTNETKMLNCIIGKKANKANIKDCWQKLKSNIRNHKDIPAGTSSVNNGSSILKSRYKLTYNPENGRYEAAVKFSKQMDLYDFPKMSGMTITKTDTDGDGYKETVKFSAADKNSIPTGAIEITKERFLQGKRNSAGNMPNLQQCQPLILRATTNYSNQNKIGFNNIGLSDPVQAYLALYTESGTAHLDKSFTDYFGNTQTATTNMYQAVRFYLTYNNGSENYYVNAAGSDGSYTFSSTGSQAQATAFGLDSSNGNLTVSGLPEGTYEWHEISTYPGYGTGSAQTFTVSADTTASCRFVNRSIVPDKGKLVIIKHNGSGEFLSGAVFEITAAEDIVINGYTVRHAGDLVDTVTTDANGRAETDTNIFRGYSYTITEIKAPVGYSRSAQPQTVKLATTVPEFEVFVSNSTWSVPVEITKKDVSTGELIPNCTFEILDENGTQIVTGVTDENGVAHFNLGYGKYFYHEIAAPEIYEIDDTPYPFEITEEGVTFKAEMTDKKKTGSIKVTKSTAENRNIEGIKFIATGISESNKGIKLEAETDENGEAVFDNVLVGKYTISEDNSTVPYGYLVADEQEVTVEYNTTAEVKVTNEEKTGTVKVHKQTEGQKNVEGITFYLKGTSDTGREINIPAITDENGIAKFENIPIGTYKVIEDKETVPYGYLVADEKEVKVEYAQTIDETILNEEMTGSITVHKKTEGQRNIEGIKFYLRGTSDTGREINIPATTDKDGVAVFENVPIGTYMIIEDEKTVPYGYLVAAEKEVTVTYAETVDAEILNNEQTGSITVHKTTEGQKNVEGIKFYLRGTSDTGREIDIPAITDENGIAKFENIPIGTYKVIEDKETVPYGYLVADEKEVKVEYAQTIDATILNEEKTGSITVHKTTEGQKNIEGIKFYLRGTSDTGREIDIPAITDENGIAKFENIPIGTYKVIEDKETVPYGYLVADEKEVTVTYAQTIDATILNNEMTGSITVHKTTEGQRNIEGIKFYLRGTSDTGREINIPATTDKDGIAKFENVPIGTYMAVEDEKTVPYGYLVADEKEVTVTYAQTIDETILNAEQTGTVQVHKKTDGMTNIEGIRFILSGVSDTGREIRIEAVTDKDGLAKFEGVPVGTYTITEDGSTVPYGYLVADSKQVTVTYAQTVDADMFNEKVPDTPNTGVSDNDIDGRTVLGGVVVILAGAAIVMFSRKRKER